MNATTEITYFVDTLLQFKYNEESEVNVQRFIIISKRATYVKSLCHHKNGMMFVCNSFYSE